MPTFHGLKFSRNCKMCVDRIFAWTWIYLLVLHKQPLQNFVFPLLYNTTCFFADNRFEEKEVIPDEYKLTNLDDDINTIILTMTKIQMNGFWLD